MVKPELAQWVLEGLRADGKVTQAEINSILARLPQEIAAIEARLASLRGSGAAASKPAPSARPAAAAVKASAPKSSATKKSSGSKSKGHVRGPAGTLIVLLRSLPEKAHARIHEIRAKQGLRAAIDAARAEAK